jgi:hypothetical protein
MFLTAGNARLCEVKFAINDDHLKFGKQVQLGAKSLQNNNHLFLRAIKLTILACNYFLSAL